MKEMELLQLFLDQPDQYVSGEQISRQLQCSRTAVWKQIRQLKNQGYEFEASPRRGYRLVGVPDRLNPGQIAAELHSRRLGQALRVFDKVDSTQTKAHEWIRQGAAEGAVVLAEEQQAGRGRMGRKWHSPAGKGIWMSVILRPRIPLPFIPQLTLLVSVAVCRAIRKVSGADARIKWPNDILIDGRKVCGILLESSAEDERLLHIVAGIGISANLERTDYPEELLERATSLFLATGRKVDRARLIGAVLEELEALYDLYGEQGFGPIRTLWEVLAMTLHRQVQVSTPQGPVEGEALGIDEFGALVVRKADGSETKVYSGDTSV